MHDWSLSSELVEYSRRPVLLAGGLTPETSAMPSGGCDRPESMSTPAWKERMVERIGIESSDSSI